MPIPFHDSESIEDLGAAAYLRLCRLSDEPMHWAGCAFLINARGEPLEFVYNRIELVPSVLWRDTDAALAAVHRLIASLLSGAVLTPTLLFVPESPVTDALLGANRSIWPDIPDIRVKLPTAARAASAQAATVIWGSRSPDAAASRLYDLIAERGLLFEPFERAFLGLREVYPEWARLMD